ncbi:MAG: PhzF family phenazine biosynthesis protein [Vicinamibacterales bacterium]
MPTLRYLHLDVFTSTRLEGNQLAVFPDPPALETELMQRIAAEMAFSESTFIYPPSGAGNARMRIFTPGEELPMAGHPTIGSAFALAADGRIPRGQDRFVFELGVGPVDVSLEWGDHGLSFAWMTQLLPAFGPKLPNRDELAAALGVEAADLDGDHPAEVVSCGVPFLFLPLRSRSSVDKVEIDRRALTRTFAAGSVDELPIFVFTTEKGEGDETVYSRMLAPGFGIAEDPATGGASGPLGCYLLQHGMINAAGAQAIVSLQGAAMKRPSRIHVAIDSDAGRITRVRVGGESVMVGRGELQI